MFGKRLRKGSQLPWPLKMRTESIKEQWKWPQITTNQKRAARDTCRKAHGEIRWRGKGSVHCKTKWMICNDCISARTGKRGLGGFPGARVCSSIPKMCSGSHLQLRVQQKTTAMSHSWWVNRYIKILTAGRQYLSMELLYLEIFEQLMYSNPCINPWFF